MKKLVCTVIMFALVCSVLAVEKKDRPEMSAGEVTVITSESLVYDNGKQSAVFEKNVVVTDPKMHMMADKLTVEFGEDNEVRYILAEGEVYIEQDDKTAWAERASYDVLSGKVVLRGDPLIKQGKDMLQGDKISFWRDDSRMICEPNARLTMFTKDDGIRGPLEGKK